MQKITPFLWYNKEAGDAAKFYTSVFKDSRIKSTQVMSDTPSGKIEVITIELMGQEFTLMSAGPMFKFTEAISFAINCATQEEVDYYWEKLTSGGGQESMCGWLKDKFGVSWQVVPTMLNELLTNKDPEKAKRAMHAMLQMKKIHIPTLQKAIQGS